MQAKYPSAKKRKAAMLACALALSFAAPAWAQQRYPTRSSAPGKKPSEQLLALCQYGEECPCPPKPAANEPKVLRGVEDQMCGPDGGEPQWDQWRPIPWDIFAQGEYIGPHRGKHVNEYRLRVDDNIDFVYFISAHVNDTPYRLDVKDKIKIEMTPSDEVNRTVEVQPDGTIILPMLKPPMRAAGKTVMELKADLEEALDEFYVNPIITVTPESVDAKLIDLTNVIDVRAGDAGRTRNATVSPDGTVQLPAIPNTFLVGLSLEEAKREINARYAVEFGRDVDVTVQLANRAPRYAFVMGEVRTPGKFELTGPTDLLQLLSMAGGPINGGNARQLVVFRRTQDWRLIATRLDIRGAAVVGSRPIPADNIWIRDMDVVVIPKTPVQLTDDALELIFTRGVYRAIPVFWSYTLPW